MNQAKWHDRFIQVNGHRTHYLEAGDGPVLVLMHGGEYGADAELTWEGCIPLLSETFRVIAPDFWGYGGSDKIRDFGGQRALMIDQVSGLLDTLCVDSAYFVGTSLSGRLLLDVANRESPVWPIDAMVVAGLGLAPPDAAAARVLGDYDGSREGLRPILRTLFESDQYAENEDYLDRRYEACRVPGAWEFGAASRLRSPERSPARRPKAPPTYQDVDAPVCLITGEHDRLVPRDNWDALAATLPGASSVVIPGAGHYPQVEQPEAFVEVLLSHLPGSSRRRDESA